MSSYIWIFYHDRRPFSAHCESTLRILLVSNLETLYLQEDPEEAQSTRQVSVAPLSAPKYRIAVGRHCESVHSAGRIYWAWADILFFLDLSGRMCRVPFAELKAARRAPTCWRAIAAYEAVRACNLCCIGPLAEVLFAQGSHIVVIVAWIWNETLERKNEKGCELKCKPGLCLAWQTSRQPVKSGVSGRLPCSAPIACLGLENA